MLAQLHAICPFGVRYIGALPDLCLLCVGLILREGGYSRQATVSILPL
jgi:hypothetical protein